MPEIKFGWLQAIPVFPGTWGKSTVPHGGCKHHWQKASAAGSGSSDQGLSVWAGHFGQEVLSWDPFTSGGSIKADGKAQHPPPPLMSSAGIDQTPLGIWNAFLHCRPNALMVTSYTYHYSGNSGNFCTWPVSKEDNVLVCLFREPSCLVFRGLVLTMWKRLIESLFVVISLIDFQC